MSGHPDWEAARERRNSAAVAVTRALIAGRPDDDRARIQIASFREQDAIMARLERELNPYTTQENQ